MFKRLMFFLVGLTAMSLSSQAYTVTGRLYQKASGVLDCDPDPNSRCWSSSDRSRPWPPQAGDEIILHFETGDVYATIVDSHPTGFKLTTPEGEVDLEGPDDDQIIDWSEAYGEEN